MINAGGTTALDVMSDVWFFFLGDTCTHTSSARQLASLSICPMNLVGVPHIDHEGNNTHASAAKFRLHPQWLDENQEP